MEKNFRTKTIEEKTKNFVQKETISVMLVKMYFKSEFRKPGKIF